MGKFTSWPDKQEADVTNAKSETFISKIHIASTLSHPNNTYVHGIVKIMCSGTFSNSATCV